jgi:streptogramin lyase
VILVAVAVAGAIVLQGDDDTGTVTTAPYVVQTIAVQQRASQVAVTSEGVWVLGRCAKGDDPCSTLRLVGPKSAQRDLVERTYGTDFDDALTPAAGSLWTAGTDDGAIIARLQPLPGEVDASWLYRDMTPGEIAEAYGFVWVLDASNSRVLRIDPNTKAATFFPLRTKTLGKVDAVQMFVADKTLLISSRCCGAGPAFAQLGRVDRNGVFSTFFSTRGQLSVATDGNNLWVNTSHGRLTRFSLSRGNSNDVRWFPELDDHERHLEPGEVFATLHGVWSITDSGALEFLDPRGGEPQTVKLSEGRIDVKDADVAVDGSRAWLLDGAHGVLYELRDPAG